MIVATTSVRGGRGSPGCCSWPDRFAWFAFFALFD